MRKRSRRVGQSCPNKGRGREDYSGQGGRGQKDHCELKAEERRLRQCTADELQQQQQQQKDAIHASTHSLATIHTRYHRVPQVLKDNKCSMANTFHLASCPCSTLQDFVAIAEMRIVHLCKYDLALQDMDVCRRRLQRHLPVMANM